MPSALVNLILATEWWRYQPGQADQGVAASSISFGPLQLSTTDDLDNMQKVHELIEGIYYSQFAPPPLKLPPAEFASTWAEVSNALFQLGELSNEVRSLRFTAGMELYHWFYFRWKDGSVPKAMMDDVSLERATEKMSSSVEDGVCNPEDHGIESLKSFLGLGCHYRWPQLVMVEAELGAELARRGGTDLRRSAQILRETLEVPSRYELQ